MTKKEYQKPAMRVVILQQQALLQTGSTFTTFKANVDNESELTYEGLDTDNEYTGGAR